MAKPTPNPIKCTGNQLLADGRLQFQFAKGQETTATVPGGTAKAVIPADISLIMIVPTENKADYTVGNMYDLQLTPISG